MNFVLSLSCIILGSCREFKNPLYFMIKRPNTIFQNSEICVATINLAFSLFHLLERLKKFVPKIKNGVTSIKRDSGIFNDFILLKLIFSLAL